LKSSDADEAAHAGYLLCLLGKNDGLPPLITYWKSHARNSSTTRLLYRAISALDDDGQTPVLAQIYAGFAKEPYMVREFYWTIRVMHGPQILKLRKKIRDEIGMEQLQ
jgi:hypothetical protein